MASLVGSPWLRVRILPEVAPPFFHQAAAFRPQVSLRRRRFSVSASAGEGEVRVRFAPSPTGNLHVGGARTALFNYLFARSKGGKFILRIEDTDLERSTKKSEEAVIRDLSWLGLEWDEGQPRCWWDFGPYRQSERNSLYRNYCDKLLEDGRAYRCFCSNEELEEMKEIAKLKQLPPVYTGKWSTATEKEIEEQLQKGTPYTYRFRVPKEGSVKINDLIRGEVSWSLDTLGDFVILRSNGQPVYNFCVTVDDASMRISHVIRAEEHLPNTLRQALIYNVILIFIGSFFKNITIFDALFCPCLIDLAPDRSKLSKRHGATSVGQFREMGYLPQAMVNYLALLGWVMEPKMNFLQLTSLVIEKFSIERVNKSGAIFDSTKLRWMNGQHLRSLPADNLVNILGQQWKTAGTLLESEGMLVEEATELLKDGIDLIADSDSALKNLLAYPYKLADVAASLISAYDSGELREALEEGKAGWQKWVKSFGKALKRKGKSLFMPLRVLLTGKLHGPEMGGSIALLYEAGKSGVVGPEVGFLTLDERFKLLRELDWEAFRDSEPQLESATTTATH
ncbi:unnamed protein product [Spirodela intermedia]|uniref:glutamate--tRNA ligase n=1 Tax=Spirodela intermedia TaxID=51605 RepID=A0A7I8JQ64_SPIIN|nr:unnamed protein product [Spirodela intermedia]CAA6672304.1 unnamed protein product [Spirodela intermedia]